MQYPETSESYGYLLCREITEAGRADINEWQRTRDQGYTLDPITGVRVDEQHIRDHHPEVFTESQNEALLAAAEMAQIDYDELLKYQLSAIRGIAGINRDMMPSFVNQSRELASSFASKINPEIADEFYSYLSNIDPNWRKNAIGQQENALNQVSSFAQELMSGEIPQDVLDNTMDSMSELGYSRGQFGGLAASNVARNLGLTSLQLKAQGAQLFTDAVSPLSARLLSTTQALMPPIINRGAMASQILGFTAGSLGSSQTGQQGVIQASQSNSDLAWSSSLSAFNASLDAEQNRMNISMLNNAISMQNKNQRLALASGIIGQIGGAVSGIFSSRFGGSGGGMGGM